MLRRIAQAESACPLYWVIRYQLDDSMMLDTRLELLYHPTAGQRFGERQIALACLMHGIAEHRSNATLPCGTFVIRDMNLYPQPYVHDSPLRSR